MVAEFELIQERKISGKGLLKVPTDKDKNRAYVLYASVIRQPKNAYKNFHYNPPRSRYGFLTFLRAGYVTHNASIEYEQQVYDGVNDIAGQTLLALKCVNNAILQSILNLSVALSATPGGQGLQPINYDNVIKEYTNLRLAWDECRLVCYADTAINLRLYRLKYDVCNLDFDDMPPIPPPPPLPPPVPPGTPILTISEPYIPSETPGEGDEENTKPFPGDTPPEPIPPPPPGTNVLLTVVYDSTSFGRQTYTSYVTTPYFLEYNDGYIGGNYTLNPSQPYGYPGINVISAQTGQNPPAVTLVSATDSSGYPVDLRYKPY